jgi:predicted O-methyltransferase YrrM
MNEAFEILLAELERFGKENDASVSERPRRMLNITRDTGEFLGVLVRATAARRILEIGTSNGYSTLWLASAARDVGGAVTTVERSRLKVELAARNFARAGLEGSVALIEDDAGRVLARGEDASFDLVFLDSERSEYAGWWPDIRRILRIGGLLVVDNALSHPSEMAALTAAIKADPGFASCLVPVGNGELMATRIG